MKHTPGPWRNEYGHIVTLTEPPEVIARVDDWEDSGNATLISAAPKLLEACESAFIGLSNGRGSVPFIISMLKSALLKAGKTEEEIEEMMK